MRLLEIAFWYTETNALKAAASTLKLFNINASENKSSLLAAIKENAPAKYFNFLNERYFPAMIQVEEGEFIRGFVVDSNNDMRLDKVKVNSFQMAQTETTVWQYFLFQVNTNYKVPETPTWQWRGDNPIVNITWHDANTYCNWLSERAKKTRDVKVNNKNKNLSSSEIYRLPTEEEWEFAARGRNSKLLTQSSDESQDGIIKSNLDSRKNNQNKNFSGDSILRNVGWYYNNSQNHVHAVRSLKPNELGIFDMSGNVAEWCNKSNLGERKAVSRGGAWDLNELYSTISHRIQSNDEYSFHSCGFRCVKIE